MELAVIGVLLTAAAPAAASSPGPSGGLGDGPTLPFSADARYVDPSLRSRPDGVGILVAMDGDGAVADVGRHLLGARAMPAIGGVRLVMGIANGEGISALESMESVYALVENRATPLATKAKPTLDRALDTPLGRIRPAQPVSIEAAFDRTPIVGGPEVTMRDVVNFTGARRAWTDLGVDGTGVTIAVVDTGVDFGAFNLGDGAVARMANGLPASFDPDGTTFAYTTINTTSYTLGGSDFVRTGGTDPLIYVFDIFGFFPGGFGPKAFPFFDLFGVPWPSDMEITGLAPSASGFYRFGILFQWNFGLDLFPILLVDGNAPFVYDTVYLDLSFDWVLQGFGAGFDYSFADEPALVPAGGPVVAARDMDGDGYVDISAGIPAHVLDIWGYHPRAADAFTVIPPIDPAGDVVGFVYDWHSHGTSVASSAAGRESNHPVAGPGTGPGASVMGIPALTWGNILEAWLWSAGFDLVATAAASSIDNYGLVYGEWTYTGNHRADIISNSWGISDWLTWRYGEPWPWYDVVTVVEDVLMTPGYADPAYPGVLMVHAAGNGASGYGTMTDPGYNTLALTVGASTSLNYTSLPMGGYFDDVISWSGRGPNALGMLKPDVLQVGAFAWTAAPIWLWPFVGGSGGVDSYTLFGGTSQATPVTSGSAAVAIEAFELGTGMRPTPAATKAILKSTATDIGYDPFLQGAGRIDVYRAASLALGNEGILVTTPATWDNARPMLEGPYAAAFAHYGREVAVAPPTGPVADASWYAGSVRRGASTSATFTVASPGGPLTGTVSAVWHSRISTIALSSTTEVLGPGWLEGYGKLIFLLPTDVPTGADLMVVRSAFHNDFLDPNGNYVWDNRSRIIVADWVDLNMDTVADRNELFAFNYGYNTGTTVEATVGFPDVRFRGSPVVWFSHAPASGRLFTPMPFELTVEFYDRVAWPWVSAPGTFSASPGAPATIAAQLSVPAGANPGLYEGQIFFTPSGGSPTAVPVSVVVPRVIDASTLSAPLTFAGSTHIYDASRVSGMFDWRWRYEAGDWKLWFVEVEDPNTIVMRVDVSWPGLWTDVDIWSIRPSGILADSTFSPYLGSGRFLWDTRTGGRADYVVVPTSAGVDQTETGMYTFALHNVLLEGATTSERLTGRVGVVKLDPRGPLTIVTQPGTAVSVPFTLSTGFDLGNVFFTPVAPTRFPMSTSPAFAGALGGGSTLPLTATITVPAGTPDGVYTHHVQVGADEFEPVLARIDVVVDGTGPGVTILSPPANAHVRGTTTITAAISDANALSAVTYDAGLAAGPMAQDGTTGLWAAPWDTTGSPDGAQTVWVFAVDEAGNAAAASVGVVVDNTAPAVAFTNPPPNAWVRGTVLLEFSATDGVSLDTAVLRYGATTVNVAGTTNLSVDTTTLGDGPWTFVLTARDTAGNERTASLLLNVDNTPPVAVLRTPLSGAFLRGSVTASFVATDANVDTATLTVGTQAPINVVGQTSTTIDTTGIADGSHAFVLTVRDLAGNAATASVTTTIDNTLPAASFTGPAAGAWVRGTVTVAFTVGDANLESATLRYGATSTSVVGQTSVGVDTTSLGDGAWTFVLTARDRAGNERTASLTLNVDNTPPVAILRSPSDGAFLRGSVTATFVATDANVDAATLTVGTQAPMSITGQTSAAVDTTAIPDGSHAWVVTVTDLAGNTAMASVTATIDNTAPVVAISAPAANQNLRGTHTIRWNATDANLDEVWLAIDGEMRLVTGMTSLEWDTTTVGDGTHSIEIVATDQAGNRATTSLSVTTDNVKAAVDAGFLNGLLIGLLVAVVLGFLIGFVLGRRRRETAAEVMPSLPRETEIEQAPPAEEELDDL